MGFFVLMAYQLSWVIYSSLLKTSRNTIQSIDGGDISVVHSFSKDFSAKGRRKLIYFEAITQYFCHYNAVQYV